MNWNPFRKTTAPAALDPLSDLTLSKLKVGYVLDYDLKTWQVTAHNRYDYSGRWTDEWELRTASDVCYLEREEDDDVSWVLYRKLPLSDVDGDVRAHIRRHDDPPETLTCRGVTYSAEDSDAGYFHKGGGASRQEFICWTYADDEGRRFLVIEQWGEADFEAALGEVVEEYMFTDILPGPSPS
jgi:hypothetical protein